jgi:hypothetical protein
VVLGGAGTLLTLLLIAGLWRLLNFPTPFTAQECLPHPGAQVTMGSRNVTVRLVRQLTQTPDQEKAIAMAQTRQSGTGIIQIVFEYKNKFYAYTAIAPQATPQSSQPEVSREASSGTSCRVGLKQPAQQVTEVE